MNNKALPTFFFSYARKDAKDSLPPIMARFFKDLQDSLEQRTPGVPHGTRLGVYDRWMTHASDWGDELSQSLKHKNAIVIVATPSYCDSKNCGKEIAIFARRHANALVDNEGALRHATNMLQIRWLEAKAYEVNGSKDAALHPILRKINWNPAEDETNERANAVRKYRNSGMELCVKPGTRYYQELLRAFTDSIRTMPTLPPADFHVSWDKIISAFDDKWHDVARETEATETAANVANLSRITTPSGPENVVVFYITDEKLSFDHRPVEFADKLIDEKSWLHPDQGSKPQMTLLLVRAMHEALLLERLNGYHCGTSSQRPSTFGHLIDQLSALSLNDVITVLVIDPKLWSDNTKKTKSISSTLREVMISEKWSGPVILPYLATNDMRQDDSNSTYFRTLPRAVFPIHVEKTNVVHIMRSVLLQERGRLFSKNAMRTSSGNHQPPTLRGPGSFGS